MFSPRKPSLFLLSPCRLLFLLLNYRLNLNALRT